MFFLRQGMQITTESEDEREGLKTRRLIFVLWILLYGFVGSQMAWTLHPFIGEPSLPFRLFDNWGGNFYSDVLWSLNVLLH